MTHVVTDDDGECRGAKRTPSRRIEAEKRRQHQAVEIGTRKLANNNTPWKTRQQIVLLRRDAFFTLQACLFVFYNLLRQICSP